MSNKVLLAIMVFSCLLGKALYADKEIKIGEHTVELKITTYDKHRQRLEHLLKWKGGPLNLSDDDKTNGVRFLRFEFSAVKPLKEDKIVVEFIKSKPGLTFHEGRRIAFNDNHSLRIEVDYEKFNGGQLEWIMYTQKNQEQKQEEAILIKIGEKRVEAGAPNEEGETTSEVKSGTAQKSNDGSATGNSVTKGKDNREEEKMNQEAKETERKKQDETNSNFNLLDPGDWPFWLGGAIALLIFGVSYRFIKGKKADKKVDTAEQNSQKLNRTQKKVGKMIQTTKVSAGKQPLRKEPLPNHTPSEKLATKQTKDKIPPLGETQKSPEEQKKREEGVRALAAGNLANSAQKDGGVDTDEPHTTLANNVSTVEEVKDQDNFNFRRVPVPAKPKKEKEEQEDAPDEFVFIPRPTQKAPMSIDKKYAAFRDKEYYCSLNLTEFWKETTVSWVAFKRDCISDMHNCVHKSHKDRNLTPETGGFLLGTHTTSKDGIRYNVVCEHFVAAHHTKSNIVEVEFTPATFVELSEEMEKYPELEVVGWFHTHPGLKAFLSIPDRTIHSNHFEKKYQIAVVVDIRNDQFGIFSWCPDGNLNESGDTVFPSWDKIYKWYTQSGN